MEWIDSLRETIVGLDTAPLIYFIEENPISLPRLEPFFKALDGGLFRAVTSTISDRTERHRAVASLLCS